MNENSQVLDLRRMWREMRRGRWLYVIAAVLMLGGATFYAMNKQDQYKIRGLVLIEDEKESGAGLRAMGGMAQMMRTFSIGGFSSDVDNELSVFSSHDVHVRAVKALGLNRTYVLHTGVFTRKLMYKDSPVMIEAPDEVFDTITRPFKVNVSLHDGMADITVRRGRFKAATWVKRNASLPCKVVTPAGVMQLLKTQHYNPAMHITLGVNIEGNHAQATALQKKVNIRSHSKKSDAIALEFKDDRERGIDIINALVAAYNGKRSDRRNEKAQAEVNFVNDRLAALQQDLADVEGRVTRFKQSNNVNNPVLEAQGWLKQSAQAQAEATAAQAELTTYEMILSTLRSAGDDAMLPAFEGVKDASITQYNELIAKRNTLSQSASAGNAALDALDSRIKPLRESIIKRAEKNIDAARIKLNAIYSTAGQAQGNYSRMPGAEQQYYDLLRDRELKNDLYVFLLEKKESSLLKLNDTTTPAFVLDEAYSADKPDSTKTLIVFAIALLLTLICPTLLLLWHMRRADRLQDPCDLSPEFEARAITLNDSTDWLNLSTAVMSQPGCKQVIIADVEGNNAPKAINALTSINDNIKAEKIETGARLESKPNAASAIDKQVTVASDWRSVPAMARMGEPQSTAILILLDGKSVKRAEFNRYLGMLNPEKCFVGFVAD